MTSLDSNVGEYISNEYFEKKLKNGFFLITTSHGSWSLLTEKEYKILKSGDFKNTDLFSFFENKGLIITKKNTSKIVNAFKSQYSFFDEPHMLCVVTLTNRCTLKCDYCHACAKPKDSKIKDMDNKTMVAVIDFICSLPHKNIGIEFQGGEPLIRFDLVKDFLLLLEKKLCLVGKNLTSRVIVTNLTLMTEKIADYVIENNIGLCSSLDGPKELHDKHRKYVSGKGSYDIVMGWNDYFNKKGRNINFLPTITSESIKFGSKSIIDEYLRLGFFRVNLRPIHRIGRGKNKSLWFDDESFFEFWKSGIEYIIELNEAGIEFYDYNTQAMLKNILTPIRSYMCMRTPCGAGISQLAFNTDGTILPCDMARSLPDLKVGNVKKHSYSDISISLLEIKTHTRDTNPLCDSCIFGAYCGNCLCDTYSAFGDFVLKTPQDFDCKIKKRMLTYLFEKLCDKRYSVIFNNWVTLK